MVSAQQKFRANFPPYVPPGQPRPALGTGGGVGGFNSDPIFGGGFSIGGGFGGIGGFGGGGFNFGSGKIGFSGDNETEMVWRG